MKPSTLAELRQAVEADKDGHWNALGVLEAAERISKTEVPKVRIEGCIFRSTNADGTPFFVFHADEYGALHHVKEINLIGAEVIGANGPYGWLSALRLPKLSDELYEFYPSMSAQTHEEAVKAYALAALAGAKP